MFSEAQKLTRSYPDRRSRGYIAAALAVTAAVAGACAADGEPGDPAGAGGQPSSTSSATGGLDPVGTGGTGGAACNPGDPSVDDDLDGFSELEGDCNDCDPYANPNAIEVIDEAKEPADEDCDGQLDEPFEPCDAVLALDSLDPFEAARALELCQVAGEGADWGLISAAYVRADGAPAEPSFNVGLLPKFGDNVVPQAGETMLGLSTGHARDPSQPDACPDGSCAPVFGEASLPPGFPQPAGYCYVTDEFWDDVALEVTLRAPSNARGFAFDHAFFSFEFPYFVCSSFNDQFIALVDPAPPESVMGNISFDDAGNPVSVNLGIFDHCDPAGVDDYANSCHTISAQCPPTPNPYCPAGDALLAGTTFDIPNDHNGGSTGWLTSMAPVERGQELTIRWAIWDAADSALDSTVVIDHFRWLAEPAIVSTIPIPDPR